MEEDDKKFGMVLIVMLIIVALVNDIAEICFDLLSLTAVGVIGEAVMDPINLVLDAFFTGVFVWKAGFGSEAVIQLVDDVLQLVFIPGRTISVGLGIWVANNPKSALSKAAALAAAAEGDGIEGGIAEEEAAQATVTASQAGEGAHIAQEGEQALSAGASEATEGTPQAKQGEEETRAGEKEGGEGSSNQGDEDADNNKKGDIELGAEISPEEEAAGMDFGSPEANYDSEDDEDEEKPDNKVVDIRTRKPLDNKQNKAVDEDLPKAA